MKRGDDRSVCNESSIANRLRVSFQSDDSKRIGIKD